MPQQRDAVVTASHPRVFTVPSGAPFLGALADAILDGNLPHPRGRAPDPLSLGDFTLLMPTRRASRALGDALLARSGRRALLMPRIRPIAETDENETLFSNVALARFPSAGPDDALPPIDALERQLTLTNLVMRWSEATRFAHEDKLAAVAGVSARTAGQAAQLAAELARLIDMIETEDVSLSRLSSLVPDHFSEHWRQTLDFLKIVTEVWPRHLAERGQMSAAARRNLDIRREAERLAVTQPKAPVIVAGVTGSIPATVALMQSVLGLPQGAIVLPGLDLSLDDATWTEIGSSPAGTGCPEHPQFGLKKLLDALGVDRRDVQTLPGCQVAVAQVTRAALFSEALRPSGSTDRWHAWVATAKAAPQPIADALAGVSIIEVPTAYDEAEVVALILREAADTPGQTAALVSPDRLLARRVAARLEAWGIKVDDSAGRPFAKTVPGTFLNLVIDAAVADFPPAAVMALLKHPLCRVGLDPFVVRRTARAIEIAAFRAPYLGRGLDGIAAALDKAERDHSAGVRRENALRRLRSNDWTAARDLVLRLQKACSPITDLMRLPERRQPFHEIASAHAAVAEALAALPADETSEIVTAGATPPSPLWQGEAGEAAATLFGGLFDPTIPAPPTTAAEYRDVYKGLIARENVRVRTPVHPRLSIWGPFEARLQQPDIVILGSLNEGTWPDSADPGPWLNRPMRQALGLPSPEEKIGHAAHDVTGLLGADRVYLTRAEKVSGAPTVPSRWLMRLDALLAGAGLHQQPRADTRWASWAAGRNSSNGGAVARITAPEPRPALHLRPRKMSVTTIERWLRNPYAVYAERILSLSPLPALGTPPGAALRGALVHEILSKFAQKHATTLPADIAVTLLEIARQTLQDYTGHARVAAFWLPRLERFIAWFAETEPQRRASIAKVYAEASGLRELPAPEGPFYLTARADRIDRRDDGSIVITDYKTGRVPTEGEVASGKAAQLPLEAAIAAGQSGFPELAGLPVAALRYIGTKGGRTPGEESLVATGNVAALADAQLQKLAELIALYDDPATAYTAIRRPRFSYDYDDYAHLARVAEWSGHDAGEDAIP